MKFRPKAIFFDWDHTLWDHDLNSREVLAELWQEFKLSEHSDLQEAHVWDAYQILNNHMWEQYASGLISQDDLRTKRFERFFDSLQIAAPHEEIASAYLFRTPRKKNLLPDAFQVIDSLAKKYPLYILTNGFDDTQHVKVAGAGMSDLFQQIITSEQAGCKKPASEFFTYALAQANCLPHEVVMVGDHAEIDVKGAEAVGIHGIHLHDNAISCKHSIRGLRELLDLIE